MHTAGDRSLSESLDSPQSVPLNLTDNVSVQPKGKMARLMVKGQERVNVQGKFLLKQLLQNRISEQEARFLITDPLSLGANSSVGGSFGIFKYLEGTDLHSSLRFSIYELLGSGQGSFLFCMAKM